MKLKERRTQSAVLCHPPRSIAVCVKGDFSTPASETFLTTVRNIALVKTTDSPTVSVVRETLRIAGISGELQTVSSLSQLRQQITSGSLLPDVGVIVEDHPQQYTVADVTALFSASPLTRWVCVRSDWCESATRTGTVWPPAVTVPARLFADRWRRECAVLAGELPPLPLTAGIDEAFLFNASLSERKSTLAVEGQLIVSSPDRAIRDWLREFFALELPLATVAYISDDGNCEPPGLSPAAKIAGVIFDLDPGTETQQAQLQSWRDSHADISVIALQTMPARQHVDRWATAGVTLLPKLGGSGQILQALSGAA